MYILAFIVVLSVCISIFYIFLSMLFADERCDSHTASEQSENHISTTRDE